MANFVIGFLEWNRKSLEKNKSIVFSDEAYFGNKWIYKYLGIVVIITHAILITGVALLLLFSLPIAFASWIIDCIYNLIKTIAGSSYIHGKHIKKSLIEYEAHLNGKNLYYLVSKTRDHEWSCVVLEDNLEEFIIKFFKSYNKSYDTYDLITHKQVCRAYRRRSIGDIYLICKNYFPDTNLDAVIKCLIRLVKADILAVSKCSDIKKYVFVQKDSYTGNYVAQDIEFIKGINFQQLIAYYERNGGLS